MNTMTTQIAEAIHPFVGEILHGSGPAHLVFKNTEWKEKLLEGGVRNGDLDYSTMIGAFVSFNPYQDEDVRFEGHLTPLTQ